MFIRAWTQNTKVVKKYLKKIESSQTFLLIHLISLWFCAQDHTIFSVQPWNVWRALEAADGAHDEDQRGHGCGVFQPTGEEMSFFTTSVWYKLFLHRHPVTVPRWTLANNPPSVNLMLFTQNRAVRLQAASVCYFSQRAEVGDAKETWLLWHLTASVCSDKINALCAKFVTNSLVIKLRKNGWKTLTIIM